MFLKSFEIIVLLLAMAIPGYIIAKVKLLKNTEGAINFISIMLLYVCQPFVTFNSFLKTDFELSIFWNMLIVFGITTVLMIGLSLLFKAIFIKSREIELKSMIAYAATFGNIGYLCLPFLQMLAPGNNEVMLYATSSIVAFNATAWTVGCYVLTGERKYIKVRKAFLNPPMVSFIIALPLFILNLNFNRSASFAGIANICRLFSEMVGPLAMIMLGIKFSEIKIKEVFTDYRVYVATALKLIISPLIGIGVLLLLSLFMDVSPIKLNIMAITSMPTAANLMMFSSLCGKDVKLSAKIVLVTTLFSIITIPLALGIADKIF